MKRGAFNRFRQEMIDRGWDGVWDIMSSLDRQKPKLTEHQKWSKLKDDCERFKFQEALCIMKRFE